MYHRFLVILTLCLLFGWPSGPADAQEQATLVSDRLEIADDNRLIASGKVEVFYQGNRLTASRVTYDRRAEQLRIEGPLTLRDETGRTIILASAAELSADLSEGLIRSARLVLDRQLQLAAANLMRVSGRYTALDQVVVSSCTICPANPVPLWEIRSYRVVHDEVAHQIYFDRAQFRIGGVPVFYIPRLRMPDPSVERASGLLTPTLRTTSDLGTGIRLPYFIVLGESRDLTLTPYLTLKDSRTLDFRYREAFSTGGIIVDGAITSDNLTDKARRGYFNILGGFDLPDDYRLAFNLKGASDNAYLQDYGYSDADRLVSRIELSRVRRNGFFSTRLVGFQSLRDDEDNNTLPTIAGDVTYHRRFSLGPLGGQGGLQLQAHQHYRTSDNIHDSDGDSIADGRDMGRLSVQADWQRGFILPAGLEANIVGAARGDLYKIRQDAVFAGTPHRLHVAAGVELRWPLIRTPQATGEAIHVIEPVIQLVWADRHESRIPNEDSSLVEFDEGNLYSLERFPGADVVEQGSRTNVGVTWTRYDPAGWTMRTTLGRVFRGYDSGLFGPATGLDGRRSDWLAAVSVDLSNGGYAIGRAVFDDDLNVAKAELRMAVQREQYALGAALLWVVADDGENPFNPFRPGEDRAEETRELRLDGEWQATPFLRAKLGGGYDFMADRGTRAGIGLEYRNECIAIDVSLSRRFTSSDSVSPTTSFGLSVDLIGFGSGKKPGPARTCSQG